MNTVHQISFFPHIFPVNCYFVKEEDGLTLIDAALPFSAKKIQLEAVALGKPIKRIILTHGHDDHVGALDQLKESYPDVPVYISKRDSRLLAGDHSLDDSEIGFPIRGGVPKKVKTKPDYFISDGDIIGSLLAISVPGHTPGSMAFLDIRNNALIAGDAFQTKGGIAVSGHMKVTFPFPALATWNKEKAITSADRLVDTNPTLLATGHGAMLENPVLQMKEAIEVAKQYVNKRKERIS